MTFYVDGVQVGTGTLNNGAASFTTSTLSVGSHTVTAEPAAIDAVQPFTRNAARAMRPSSISADSLNMSPHAGFITSTLIAGASSRPALRGF